MRISPSWADQQDNRRLPIPVHFILNTMRMSDYVPQYSETSSVGKRMPLLPDEVLRFPIDQALVIIRGQKVLRVRKFDYTKHPEAGKLVLEKTESHVPAWQQRCRDSESGGSVFR